MAPELTGCLRGGVHSESSLERNKVEQSLKQVLKRLCRSKRGGMMICLMGVGFGGGWRFCLFPWGFFLGKKKISLGKA